MGIIDQGLRYLLEFIAQLVLAGRKAILSLEALAEGALGSMGRPSQLSSGAKAVGVSEKKAQGSLNLAVRLSWTVGAGIELSKQ